MNVRSIESKSFLCGLQETRAALDGTSAGYFGDPYAHAVAHASIRGLTFAFIGFNQFDPDGWRMAASTTRVQIVEARGAGELPIVFAHWGDEYASTTPLQRELAQSFADAGAAFIVGAHPHVVQGHALLQTRSESTPVYYSLGNLIFDQYWDASVRRGLLLRVTFGPTGVTGIEEIPVELGHDRRTCPMM
jgi:poly-gamma-glutamate synthesis protein (capsule biosynthesis protein)